MSEDEKRRKEEIKAKRERERKERKERRKNKARIRVQGGPKETLPPPLPWFRLLFPDFWRWPVFNVLINLLMITRGSVSFGPPCTLTVVFGNVAATTIAAAVAKKTKTFLGDFLLLFPGPPRDAALPPRNGKVQLTGIKNHRIRHYMYSKTRS